MADESRPERKPAPRPAPDRFELNRLAEATIALLEGELAASGFELLDVRLFRGGGRVQVRVFVDRPVEGTLTRSGISMDEVALASRTVSMLLEEADLFVEAYVIEVSSPGIRRPLRTPAHFAAAVGQKIDLKIKGQKTRLRGVLTGYADGVLSVTSAVSQADAADVNGVDGEPATVDVDGKRVLEANLDPEFDVQAIINADRRRRKDGKRQQRQERPSRKKGRPKGRTDAGPDAGDDGDDTNDSGLPDDSETP